MNYSVDVLILCMAAITFSCRYLFFMNSFPVKLGPKSKKLLKYTAPSVLTAMWAPIVFLGHESAGIELIRSPYLYAGLLTIMFCVKVRNTLAIVSVGMVSFLAFSWFLKL